MYRTRNYPLFSDKNQLSLDSVVQYVFTFGFHRVAIEEAGEYIESKHTYDDGLCIILTWDVVRSLRTKATMLRNVAALRTWHTNGFVAPVSFRYTSLTTIPADTTIDDWYRFQDILAMQHHGVSAEYYHMEMNPKIHASMDDKLFEELFASAQRYLAFERYLKYRKARR